MADMRACPLVLAPAILSCIAMRSTLSAGTPWRGIPCAPLFMAGVYGGMTDIVSISPRFAARLVHAGALTAMERLGAKAVEDEARVGALNSTAPMDQARSTCFTAFKRSVLRVSCRATCAGSAWVSCRATCAGSAH